MSNENQQLIVSSNPHSHREETSFKRAAQFILLILLFTQNLTAQNEKKVSSQITHVTVFLNQAQVQRDARLVLEAGTYTLVFENISPNLIPNSIEVKVSNGISLLSVSTQNDYLKRDEKPAHIIALEDSIELLNEHLADYKADKESIVLQKELLLANKNVGGSTVGVKADELEDVLAIYQKKLEEFKVDWMRLSKKEKETILVVQNLQRQLDEYLNGTLSLSNQILVNVKSDKAIQDVDISINYLVSGVSWQPYYDIRVKDTKSPVQFLLKANLLQSTGENWKNVKLKFTTANPLAGGTKPVLSTNFLNFDRGEVNTFNPYRGNVYKAPAPVMSEFNNTIEFVKMSQNMINTEFDINVPYSIPSDNQFHQVDLTAFSQPAVYGHAAVPKVDKDVFVTADVVANDLINQISGEANVYFEGTFTGKTQINPTANDTLVLTLGRDKRIVVNRTKLKEMSSKSFFGSTKKESNTYEISVKNTTADLVELTIEDQVPVSADKEIEIKPQVNDGGILNTETGKVEWKLKLQPQQQVKVRFSFEISYPSNKKISTY